MRQIITISLVNIIRSIILALKPHRERQDNKDKGRKEDASHSATRRDELHLGRIYESSYERERERERETADSIISLLTQLKASSSEALTRRISVTVK